MQKVVSKEIYGKIEHAKGIASLYPDASFIVSKEAYILAQTYKLPLEEAYALIGMALACRAKSDISGMLDYSYKALSIFKDENDIKGRSKALNLIGIAYFYSAMYEESMNCFLEIIELLESNKDDFLFSSVLNNMGEIYRESKMYDQAIDYYKKAIDIVIINNMTINHAVLLSNIGEVHFMKNELYLALEAYRKSHNMLLIDGNDMVSLGEVENRIGMVYFAMNDTKNAKKYYYTSLKRLENINNKYYAIEVLINIANVYIDKSPKKALDFYEKAMEFAKDIGSKKKISQVYKHLSECYEILGDYKNALEYYKVFFNFNEEVMSLNLGNKLEILNIELKNFQKTGQYEKLSIRLEMEIKRQKNEIEKINIENKILEKKAYEDELTGIKNRRSINTYLKEILLQFYSNEENIVLFMIDIDRFKRYNDYWGHSEGDICIRAIADCIKKTQNKRGDIFGRYGGEEFVYIATSLNYDDAFKVGNLLRIEVENLGLYYMYEGEKKKVTISIGGVIGMSSEFGSMTELMEFADKELYNAKNMGRNLTILKQINANDN